MTVKKTPLKDSAVKKSVSSTHTQTPKKENKVKKSSAKELGKRGEAAAARYLVAHGYEIIERNYSCIYGEADIIARDQTALVFIEVKTRSSEQRGLPEEAVTPEKRRRYENIAMEFLKTYDVCDCKVRFDVVAIKVVEPQRAFVRHHINAFGRD